MVRWKLEKSDKTTYIQMKFRRIRTDKTLRTDLIKLCRNTSQIGPNFKCNSEAFGFKNVLQYDNPELFIDGNNKIKIKKNLAAM